MDEPAPSVRQPPFVVLSDGVITLRCLELSDCAAHLAGEDEDQVRWLNEGHRSTADRVPTWIRSNQQEWLTGGPRRHVGIRDARSDTLVGNAEAHLALHDLAPGEVNLSYAVFPEWRGRGTAARAVMLLCGWLASTTAARTAVLRIAPGNEPSRRVALAAGFWDPEGVVGQDGLLRYERSLRRDG